MSALASTAGERLAARSRRTPTGCLVWTGATSNRGYGQINVAGVTRSTHRVAYELAAGPIPEGLTIDHLCGVRTCVEPTHLEAVTIAENLLRALACPSTVNAAKTSCLRGHPLAGDNLVIKRRGALPAVRNCRTCTRDAAERRRRASAPVPA